MSVRVRETPFNRSSMSALPILVIPELFPNQLTNTSSSPSIAALAPLWVEGRAIPAHSDCFADGEFGLRWADAFPRKK